MKKLKKLKAIIPVLGTVCVVLLFHFSKIYALKFYPVIVNSFIFCVFFSSVFCEETIIQKIAKKMDGELTDFSRNYTRKLTYVWCIFLFVNLSISFATVSAVKGLSPVIIAVLMPAFFVFSKIFLTSSLGGSAIATKPI